MQIGRKELLVASDSCLPRRQLSTNTNQEAPAPSIWPCVAASQAHLCAKYYSQGQEMNLSFNKFEERGAHEIFGSSAGAFWEAHMAIKHASLI